jgi:hypothetical protein
MRSVHPAVIGLALLSSPSVFAAHGDEPPHYTRPPFSVSTPASVAEFSLSSDRHLDAVAMRLGPASRRVLGMVNDGRGLADNWSGTVVLSDDTNVVRAMNEDSCQAFQDQAFVAWLDDRDGAGATRVHFNRYDRNSDAWGASPTVVDDSTYPSGSDVTDFRMIVKRGTSGSATVVVLVRVRASGEDHVLLTVSPDAGATFLPAVPVTTPVGSPGNVGAVACDLRLGALHLAWSDDRAGSTDVYYRTAILDFAGTALFLGPETAISSGQNTEQVGRLVLQAGAEFGWTGSDQKYVGVAYLQEDGDGTRDLHLATSRDDGLSFTDVVISQTAVGGTEVESFDLEIPGDTFVVTWQDDSSGTQQVYRSESDDGLAFTDPVRMSASEDPSHQGFAPRISPSFGTPDGACIAFLELGEIGLEVHSAFADQSFGGSWHDEEYPRVSAAQSDPPVRDVADPDLAYNQLYYDYLVGWREETAPGSGIYSLVLGGYRPPFVILEGYEALSRGMQFEILHVPFQDTFGFVMVSLASPTSGAGTLLYDGRRTGFVSDATTGLWLTSRWKYAFFRNDSAGEGGLTRRFPLPPMLEAPDLTFLAVTWGPFGEYHTLTEPFTLSFGSPPTPPSKLDSAP